MSSPSPSDSIENWKTGDLVLCKVGSFPPWPAVIFPQRFLRNDVYKKKKPKCVAVCFFNDPTYYWEHPHKLRPLTRTIINESIRSLSSTTELFKAFKIAKHYFDLETFIRDRFIEENRLDQFNKEVGTNGKPIGGEDPFLSKNDILLLNKKSEDRTTNGKTKDSKVSNKRKITKIDNEQEEDEEIISEDEEKKQLIKKGSPHQHLLIDSNNKAAKNNSKKIKTHTKLDRSRQIEISLLFRRRIQSNLVQRDIPPTKEGIEESHKLLYKIYENLDNNPSFFDLNTLRKSKLHKLLKVIVNDYKLEEFHQICKDILSSWSNIILQLKREKEKNRKLNMAKASADLSPVTNGSDDTNKIGSSSSSILETEKTTSVSTGLEGSQP